MDASLVGNWNYPTSVRFGAGRIRELAQHAVDLGMRKPLLVTDPGLARLPMVHEAVVSTREAGLLTEVFSDVRPNPTGADVFAGVKMLREGAFDGVIAFGGGSALDVGKAVALMAHQTRPLWDFEDVGDWWTRVDVHAMVPVVAVPTTSGTGSEVGRASVIVHEASKTKKIIFHPRMLPERVVCDPALTVGLPAPLTAATGLDALSHNLEAWCAPGFHPLADGIAMQGIRLIQASLLDAVRNGADLEARGKMMAASLMGATAFQKGLGAMHGIAHVVGAQLDAHHGLLNAIVMPYVLMHNRRAIEPRIIDLARAMGLKPTFAAFIDWVLHLRRECDIPPTLEDVGLAEGHIDRMARASVADPSTGTNPVPMDAESYERLYRRCLLGDLSA
ncbi:MAG: iron-containing alcohol dehydrogenase [Alphaproteobacteria bacterium]|nr:iron-containing alcohol dehydrogenase [Alphaproteobacteria bacterium]